MLIWKHAQFVSCSNDLSIKLTRIFRSIIRYTKNLHKDSLAIIISWILLSFAILRVGTFAEFLWSLVHHLQHIVDMRTPFNQHFQVHYISFLGVQGSLANSCTIISGSTLFNLTLFGNQYSIALNSSRLSNHHIAKPNE